MDLQLLESLLYEEESEALDFKVQRYSFSGATDEQKSELLKDILAFANAWRQTDAHILIGVREVRGGRSIVVGIDPKDHLLNRNLQQFVHRKTNRVVDFWYAPAKFEGVDIGVLTRAWTTSRTLRRAPNRNRWFANAMRGTRKRAASPATLRGLCR